MGVAGVAIATGIIYASMGARSGSENVDPASTQSPASNQVPISPPAAPSNLEINPELRDEFIRRGIPAEDAEFLSATKVQVNKFERTALDYTEIYANGAKRDVKISLIPDQEIVLTQEEFLEAQRIGISVYRINFTHTDSASGSQSHLEFFSPYDTMPADLRAHLQSNSEVAPAFFAPGIQFASAQDPGTAGSTVVIDSTVQESVEQGLGQAAELAGRGQGVMAMISALLDLMQAVDLSRETFGYYSELDALQNCADNPTSLVPVSQAERDRTRTQLDNIRTNLKFTTGMRFIGQMADAPLGFAGPVGAAASVVLKPIGTEADQAMKGFIQNTLMDEARRAVVPCNNPISTSIPVVSGVIIYEFHAEGETTYQSGESSEWEDKIRSQGQFTTDSSGKGNGTATWERTLTGKNISPPSYREKYVLASSTKEDGSLILEVEAGSNSIMVKGSGTASIDETHTTMIPTGNGWEVYNAPPMHFQSGVKGFECSFEEVDLVNGGSYTVEIEGEGGVCHLTVSVSSS